MRKIYKEICFCKSYFNNNQSLLSFVLSIERKDGMRKQTLNPNTQNTHNTNEGLR